MEAIYNLAVVRETAFEHQTLGKLYIDGVWQFWTLEDRLRPVSVAKVPGQTAIPAGKYQVLMTLSTRFKRVLPLLVGVPGFTAIRLHPGNTDVDTEGCILVGGGINKYASKAEIIRSREASDRTNQFISAAIGRGQQVWLEILDACQPWTPGSQIVVPNSSSMVVH